MTAWAWVAVAVWAVVSLPAALVIGRVIRNRDRQIPRDEP